MGQRAKDVFASVFTAKLWFSSAWQVLWNNFHEVGCKRIDAHFGPLVMRRIKLSKLLLSKNSKVHDYLQVTYERDI